jgi:hypothetical protein
MHQVKGPFLSELCDRNIENAHRMLFLVPYCRDFCYMSQATFVNCDGSVSEIQV